MELYVLTYVEDLRWEPGGSSFVGVFDSFDKAKSAAETLGFPNYKEDKDGEEIGFFDPSKCDSNSCEWLRLDKGVLNKVDLTDEV
ncbi:hypothetical protein HWC53_gp105 [Bacillus phage vB_BmeM-Goe8]|uniref:Uncharacterized protein n=1 Tax=Bacillus phage vB_BmeM-Goe8 TaxID=2593638 RepID=A0A516KN11_9CAUD|nr:hypothetical protein HWC53_gp105 [Bacillus phage vB_BmeM-Goe8]QDP42984.1 hypothetical protein Goe8_c02110 [Bacillus phage vB_BmeM-Goe8]